MFIGTFFCYLQRAAKPLQLFVFLFVSDIVF